MFADVEKTFKTLRWLIPIYASYLVFSSHFSSYEAMAPFLFKPVGLLTGYNWKFPNTATILLIQMSALVSSSLVAINRFTHPSSWVLFTSLFLLDFFSNSFGFINVQIHFVWFCFFYALSFKCISKINAFRAMELVLVLAYVQAAYAKLQTSGIAWAIDGTTLQIAWMRQGLALGQWLSQFKMIAILASWASLLLEGAFIFYYPFPKIRRLLLILSVIFHLGTWVSLGIDFSHLWIFSISILLNKYELNYLKEFKPCPTRSLFALSSRPTPKLL